MDREQSIRTLDSFKILISLLKAGEKIVIFPEGTYVRNGVGSGKSRLLQMILRFQSELGYSIPFVPVGIRYGGRSGWRRRVEVCIGSPLFAEKDSDALPLTHRALEEISRLSQLPLSPSSEFRAQSFEKKRFELFIFGKGGFMPRGERERELARRRKRKKERKKLRAKGLLESPAGGTKETGKKKPEKKAPKEAPPETVEKPPSES